MSNTFTRPPLPAIPPPSLHLLWPSTSVAFPEPFPQEMLVSVRSSCSGQAGSWSVCPVGREKRLASKGKKISKLNISPELLSQNQPSRRNPAIYKYTSNPESDSLGLCDLGWAAPSLLLPSLPNRGHKRERFAQCIAGRLNPASGEEEKLGFPYVVFPSPFVQ